MTTSQVDELRQLYSRHLATLSQRYAEALEHCGADRALVFAGTPQLRDRDDQTLPFRSDPYFLQWVPLRDAAGSVVEFRAGHKPKLVYVTADDFWHAPPQAPSDAVLDEFEVLTTTSEQAASLLRGHGETTVAIGQIRYDVGEIDDSNAFREFLDFGRAAKTQYEIECMRLANRCAVAGHKAVARALQQGVSEFELHLHYCRAAKQGDEELPYPSIIGLNEHAAVLHYQHRETQAPPETHSLLIDAGAQLNGYAADVTRTWALGKNRFADLIDAADKLQQDVCARVRAGADFIELNDHCHALLAQVLVDFDLVRCSAESAYEQGITTVFLPHGLGHLLGLQVHDVGGHLRAASGAERQPPERHPFLRLTRTLEADMVVTIEPGIYFIDRLLENFAREKPGLLRRETLEAFRPYGGIRIEDNVRVKSRGHENLTRDAFSDQRIA